MKDQLRGKEKASSGKPDAEIRVLPSDSQKAFPREPEALEKPEEEAGGRDGVMLTTAEILDFSEGTDSEL